MIQTIEIMIKMGINNIINAIIVYPKNICYLNNVKYEVDDDFLDDIAGTIALWRNEYGYDENIDSEEFTIIVTTDEGKETMHGKGIYPHNYEYLKELLGDLND